MSAKGLVQNMDSLRLFARLKQKKQIEPIVHQEIYGVQVVQSDCSDDEHAPIIAAVPPQALEEYKKKQAQWVLKLHLESGESISSIVMRLKDKFKHEARCILEDRYSSGRKGATKQVGSTLPNSQERQPHRQTPGFDWCTTNGESDPRQFTLGQKEESPQGYSIETDLNVTEFQVNNRKSTKNIKNRIMMKRDQ